MLDASGTFRLVRCCGPTDTSLSEENAAKHPFSGFPVNLALSGNFARRSIRPS
jgi:hypothetical protein